MTSLVGTRRGATVGSVVGSSAGGVAVYPQTSAHVAALTGVTPSALYLYRATSGAVPDVLGGTSLAAGGAPTYQAQVGDGIGVDYATAGAYHRADVNGLGVASWLYAAIFRAPMSAVPSLPTVIGRFDGGETVGAALYLQTNQSVTMLVRDGVSTLIVNSPPATLELGGLYLAQLQIDRAAAQARVRVSRLYGGAVYAAAGSIAGYGTLSTAGQNFGTGAISASLTYGCAVSWVMAATGAQVEGAGLPAAFARSLGAE